MVTGVIKTISNIRIYRPHVFHVRSGPNQQYSPECVLLQVELHPRGTERTSGDRMKSAILLR